jgi:hypothetical protein
LAISLIQKEDDVMKTWKLITCAMLLTTASNAWSFSVEENNGFAALQWTFGEKSLKPDVIVGYRSVDVETDGDVSGWQASASYAPHEGIDKLKVEGVTGDEDVQYTYGAGYSLQQRKALVTAGVTGNYLSAGADVVLGGHRKKLEAYFGVNTIGDYDVPNEPVNDANSATIVTSNAGSNADSNVVGGAAGSTAATALPVNDNLQTEHFPEFTDCGC